MSSGTATPPVPISEVPVVPLSECEVVIDDRLRKTQRHVKGVDVAEGLVTLAVGILAYLLVAALIDHWLVEGGLSFAGRLWLWAALVGIAGAYFARRVLPPLVRRINPLFAAATIEHSQPTLKNSLINFLLLRGHKRELAAPVYQAMERRAADDLNHVEIEVVVDRSHVIRMGVALAVVLAIFSLYLVVSPKNPIRSAARVLWPWSNIAAPTRVMILDVQPGSTAAFHGENVAVSAEITGLNDADTPQVIYSTADGQTVDQSIPLVQAEGEYRHQCQLPPGKLGMQQDITYYLTAGDCRTERFRVNIQVAPAISVDSVAYHYPPYTGLSDETLERQGDVRAIEGTEVTVRATANTEIKPGSAEIDLGCTGRQGLRMSVEGRTAIGRFTLRLNAKDPALAEYDSYQIRFADLQGRENQPIRHRIDVIRDLPPDNVQIVEPKKDDVQVAVRGKLAIKVQAEDPDFGLRTVAVRAQREERSLLIPPLLDRPKPELAWTGKFTGTYVFEPGRLGLKAGDRVEYWVEAEDNREPTPGRGVSNRQWITVVDSKTDRQSNREEAEEKAAGNKEDEGEKQKEEARDQSDKNNTAKEGEKNESNEKPTEGTAAEKPQPGENKADQPKDEQNQQQQAESAQGDKASESQAGQGDNKQGSESTGQDKGKQSGDKQSGDKQQKSQGGEKSNERIDPDTAPGDAMQEILNEREKQQQEKKQNDKASSKGNQSKEEDQPSEDKGQKSGEKQQAEKQEQEGMQPQQSGEKGKGEKNAKQQGKDKTHGQKAGEQKAGEGEAGEGEAQAGEKNAEGKKGEGKKAGKEQAGGKSSDQQNAGDKQEGGEPSDKQKAGGKEGGTQAKQGEKAGSKGQKDDNQKAAGEKEQAEKTEGQEQGEGKQEGGEKKQGEQGQQQSERQSTPGAGKETDKRSGGTSPENENKDRAKKPDHAADAPGEGQGEKTQSPGTSPKQSDSQGETEGDRSGGGEAGGGQQSNKKGVGGAGTHTPAEEGGSKSDEQGEGETGTKAGDQAASKKPTGSAAKQSSENGTGAGQKPEGKAEGGKPSDSSDQGQGTPQEKPSEGGKAGKQTSQGPGTRGSGPPTGGGKPGQQAGEATPPEPADNLADEANLNYSRHQTELALEYLRDQLAKEKPELLEKLGWTKDDARRFLERWEQMRESAGEKGASGESARKRFEDALRSLGLRPRGAELKHGGVEADKTQKQRDAGRFAPPPDWAEQFREYTKGVAGERRGK